MQHDHMITITDRERISRWGKTRPSHNPFSHRKGGQSWRRRRLLDCTTVTSDGPSERARIWRATRGLCSDLGNLSPNCASLHRVPPRTPITRLKQVHELLQLRGSPRGTASTVGCTEFSLGTDKQVEKT